MSGKKKHNTIKSTAVSDGQMQSLRLAQRMGLVSMGRVALDGTKLRASAPEHKAMSYGRLCEKEAAVAAEVAALREQIEAMLGDAEATDAAEDARFGVDGRQADLPDELAHREARLAKMREAKAALEAEAAGQARPAAEQQERNRQAAAPLAAAMTMTPVARPSTSKLSPRPAWE